MIICDSMGIGYWCSNIALKFRNVIMGSHEFTKHGLDSEQTHFPKLRISCSVTEKSNKRFPTTAPSRLV